MQKINETLTDSLRQTNTKGDPGQYIFSLVALNEVSKLSLLLKSEGSGLDLLHLEDHSGNTLLSYAALKNNEKSLEVILNHLLSYYYNQNDKNLKK
mmetsp:Transcript_6480/g.5783  ORF Transcript_6480/g.5783 Transcript_6480/m.5783 type:complete len:96 (+) Transcript_6480:164-451(+)